MLALILLAVAAQADNDLQNLRSGLCLSAEDVHNGGAVLMKTCADVTSQDWSYNASSKQINLKGTDFCLNLPNMQEKDNGRLEIATCATSTRNQYNGNNNNMYDQKFAFNQPNAGNIKAYGSANKCGGDPGTDDCCLQSWATQADGTKAVVKGCTSTFSSDQVTWELTDESHIQVDLPFTGLIRKFDGKCMSGDKVTKTMSMVDCATVADSEMWSWSNAADVGTKQIKQVNSDYCLHIADDQLKHNGIPVLAECNGNDDPGVTHQMWSWSGTTGQFSVVGSAGQCGTYIDASNNGACCLNSFDSTSNLIIRECDTTKLYAQSWLRDTLQHLQYACSLHCTVGTDNIIRVTHDNTKNMGYTKHRCYNNGGNPLTCSCECL
jgi:hypothetical protein